MKWNFKWIKDWDYIQSSEFISWWEDIFAKSLNKNIFFSHVMVLTWMKEKKAKPFFCIAESTNITVFYPLIMLKMGIFNWCGPVGKDEFDYLEPLFCGTCDIETITSFWENLDIEILKLKKHWDILKFRGIREEFISKNSKWQKEDICPGISISKYTNIEEFMLIKGGSFRRHTYKQIRKLKSLGELNLHIYERDDPKLDFAINDLLRNREMKWKYLKEHRLLFKSIIAASIKRQIGQLSELRIGETAISWNLRLLNHDIFYYYIPVTNSEFLNYSPGKIHLYYLLDYAFKNGMSYFDLMRGSDEYKQQWSNTQNQTYSYYTTSPMLKTKLKFLVSNLKTKVFHLIRHLRLIKNNRTILLKPSNDLSLI